MMKFACFMSDSNVNPQVQTDEIKLAESPVLRLVLLISGFVLVGIGVLGMFLPLLPTTVFLLLAAWCFARSSERFYKWVHYNRLFGKYIRDYQTGRGMTIRAKIFSISFLWLGILASAYWGTEKLFVRFLLLAIAIGVTWHLAVIKTNREI
jgi:uncharacterized protein